MKQDLIISAELRTRAGKLLAQKDFAVSVKNISTVRRWLTRVFNRALKEHINDDTILDASFHGQLMYPPYTMYSGSLTGLRGHVVRKGGSYDV